MLADSTLTASAAASDAALARRAGLGDAAAFAELFQRHFHPSFRYALHMLDGEEQLVQDAVQDTWIKAWQHLPDFRGDSRFQTWLFKILARVVVDARRRRRPVVMSDEALVPLVEQLGQTREGDPAHSVEHLELWATLAVALSELPWRQRASWLLKEFEGQSYEEIAQILGTTPTVVRGQLHRARRALAARMEQWR